MKKTALFLTVVFCISLAVASGSGRAFAADPVKPRPTTNITPTPSPTPTPIPTPTQTIGKKCFDLVPELTMTKALSAGAATITLRGKVCNKGLYVKDYVTPPAAQAEGIFWQDMRYPPLTFAQMGTGSVLLARFKINSLKAGQCQSLTHVVKFPGVLQWGTSPPLRKGTRLVEKSFALVVGKATDQVFQVPSEECNNVNNDARVIVQYVERIP